MNAEDFVYIERQAGLYGIDPRRMAEELARYEFWNEWALMNAVARCQEYPVEESLDEKARAA